MKMDLRYNDVIAVPDNGIEADGIYWLRLYRSEDVDVAIITEVPGNQGRSVCNGIEKTARWILNAFELIAERTIWFECWPAGFYEDKPPRYAKVSFGDLGDMSGPDWGRDIGRSDVEAIVGTSLAPIPSHEELLDRVIVAGGDLTHPGPSLAFKIVPTNDLPAPHQPFRCAHYERYKEIAETMGNNHQNEQAVGRAFQESLTPSDYRKCRFHKGNWNAIATTAVRIVYERGSQPTDHDISEVAEEAKLSKKNCMWLRSLFGDAIFIEGGSYTNGQHRGCALRVSGAPEIVVRCDGPEIEPCTWIFEGD